MESILSYLDYRHYLKDYYAYQKANKKFFSYRYFCQKTGIKSPVFLKEIYDGKRNLTDKMTEKFLTFFNFNNDESNYFRILVQFNQAATPEARSQYLKLLKEQVIHVSQHVLNTESLVVYENWYTLVIRELITQEGYHHNSELLAKQVYPAISKEQAEEAISQLLRFGFVAKDENGKYILQNRAISSGPAVSQYNRTHNLKMLELARNSIVSLPLYKRYCKGLVLGIDQQCYSDIIKEIETFKKKVISLVEHCKSSNEVYELYLQLFPLSQKSNWKEEEDE